MSIEILQSSASYDKTYFVKYDGAFRECKFLGTCGITKGNSCVANSYYMLDVAGIGRLNIEFDRMGNFDDWYHKTNVKSILAETFEDAVNGIFINDKYGSTGNAYNGAFMSKFFPKFKVCQCGGNIHSVVWDGTEPISVLVYVNNKDYIIDENGFHYDFELSYKCAGYNGYYYTIGMNVLYKDMYRTNEDAIRANEVKCVTF